MPQKKTKTGVLIATYNRPDLIRLSILQLQNQTMKPDYVVVHHNGNEESYEWAIIDLDTDFPVVWIHTPEKLSHPHHWYLPALEMLESLSVDALFWVDHDDIYKNDHLEEGLKVLKNHDFGIQKQSDVLLLGKSPKLIEQTEIPHAPGGMASSMCFNLKFAQDLIEKLALDLTKKVPKTYPDEVLAEMLPSYKVGLYEKPTCMYVCHPNAVSSSHWLKEYFDSI